jgi:hypothetical protein
VELLLQHAFPDLGLALLADVLLGIAPSIRLLKKGDSCGLLHEAWRK